MEYNEVCKCLENDPELLAFVNHLQIERSVFKDYCASLKALIDFVNLYLNDKDDAPEALFT